MIPRPPKRRRAAPAARRSSARSITRVTPLRTGRDDDTRHPLSRCLRRISTASPSSDSTWRVVRRARCLRVVRPTVSRARPICSILAGHDSRTRSDRSTLLPAAARARGGGLAAAAPRTSATASIERRARAPPTWRRWTRRRRSSRLGARVIQDEIHHLEVCARVLDEPRAPARGSAVKSATSRRLDLGAARARWARARWRARWWPTSRSASRLGGRASPPRAPSAASRCSPGPTPSCCTTRPGMRPSAPRRRLGDPPLVGPPAPGAVDRCLTSSASVDARPHDARRSRWVFCRRARTARFRAGSCRTSRRSASTPEPANDPLPMPTRPGWFDPSSVAKSRQRASRASFSTPQTAPSDDPAVSLEPRAEGRTSCDERYRSDAAKPPRRSFFSGVAERACRPRSALRDAGKKVHVRR